MGLSCDVMHILTGAQRPMEESRKYLSVFEVEKVWVLCIRLSGIK